jgi:uracil-DNA glycosylase
MQGPVLTQFLEAVIKHLQSLDYEGAEVLRVSSSTVATLARPRLTSGSASKEKSGAKMSLDAEPQAVRCPDPAKPSSRPTLLSSYGLNADSKQSAFQKLEELASKCTKCQSLAYSRKNVVFGTGSLNSEILFIGEAPGAEEDATGRPFVGKAGELLTRIIQAMGLSRETVFIANVLKCRPDTPGKSSGNRKPSPIEMATCLPYLQEQIAIIRPKVMVALGSTAIEGLLRTPVQVTRMRGQWFDFHGIPVMPTYHPAYLLRSESMAEKRKVWEDMLSVMEKLELPISQKQRNFFLKPS